MRITARSRGGVAAVEAATLLPVLVLTLFGIWEVGRLINLKLTIYNACREGARQASTAQKTASASHPDLPGNPHYEVQEAVLNYLKNAMQEVPVDTEVSVTNTTTGRSVVVKTTGMSGPLVTYTQVSGGADPVATANRMDELFVEVVFPVDSVKWSPAYWFSGPDSRIRDSATWLCLKDEPLTANPSIPTSPLR
jgi:Flp pilus assembly protein TadG